MAATSTLSFRNSVLPWALSHEDEQRFRRLFWFIVLLCLCFGVVLPWLPRPAPELDKAQPLPPPIAKLLLDRPVTPPPPPPVTTKIEVPKPNAEDKTEPAPLPTKPVTKQPPVVEARNPQPNKPPGEQLEAARNRAAGVGLLAMKDTLAELHGAPTAVQLNQDIKPGPGVGSGVGVGVGAGKEAGLPDRAMITSNATGGSGGINTAGYSRDTGGGGLAGRSTTLVAGVAGGGGGGGYGGGGGVYGTGGHGTGTGAKAGGSVQRGASGKATRSIEEVRLVLERAKAALYAIYNRALREDPTLRGRVVVEFTIAPNGSVTNCRFVSSELQSPDLEQKLIARFRSLGFGAEDVDTLITTYPIDFLPSS
jgi:TonB family protein